MLVKLENLETRIRGLVPGLKGGSASSAAINDATNAVDSQSSGLGFHIHDITRAI